MVKKYKIYFNEKLYRRYNNCNILFYEVIIHLMTICNYRKIKILLARFCRMFPVDA